MADIKCPHCGNMVGQHEMIKHLMDEHQMSQEDAQKWMDDNKGGQKSDHEGGQK